MVSYDTNVAMPETEIIVENEFYSTDTNSSIAKMYGIFALRPFVVNEMIQSQATIINDLYIHVFFIVYVPLFLPLWRTYVL